MFLRARGKTINTVGMHSIYSYRIYQCSSSVCRSHEADNRRRQNQGFTFLKVFYESTAKFHMEACFRHRLEN